MSDRPQRKPINLSPTVKRRWDAYKAALESTEGRRATDDDIVGAFLEGVPLWQANLMIGTYIRGHDIPLDDIAHGEE